MENKELKDLVINALKEVYDPEIAVDVYELGLIYSIKFDENANVEIIMTLTTPNCPVADNIVQDVYVKVNEIPEINDVDLHLTFDPPWNDSMASEVARLEMGLL